MRRAHGAALAGIFAATVLVLLFMGRTWWGTAEPGLWTGGVGSAQNSQLLFDPYTFTHISHGIGFYLAFWLLFKKRLPFGTLLLMATALEAGWEILENTNLVIERYREVTIAQGYFGDSIANSLGDIAVTVVGFWLAARLPLIATIALFVGIEVVLALTIRDNLLLNIVMLLYPIPAIQAWQLGG
ncbi:MAG: DUF2585 family protein [Candidatus Niyogibacteria bacterium]|nr:DUF2585 family protein [Candidatus Niyogibacteria bacterium]